MAQEVLVCPVRADWGLPLVALLLPVMLLAPATPSAAQEAWTPTSLTNAPTARIAHTAVWTGSKMIVWGGLQDYYGLNTGGIYDPTTDTWTATSTTNAPAGRYYHTAVWTGSRMIVWGGYSAGTGLNTGGVYDPKPTRGRRRPRRMLPRAATTTRRCGRAPG